MDTLDLLNKPPQLPLIFPSILASDFSRVGDDAASVLEAGADGLHLDVMDGHFVPNLTMGPAMVQWLRQRFGEAYLDVHLMVTNPEQWVKPFADAGADCITFHIEATMGRRSHHERELIQQIRQSGCDVGVALNPPTPAGAVQHIVHDVDMVLVMSVHPGFGGQKFIADVLEKVQTIRKWKRDLRIEMDGGIDGQTVKACRDAGCDVIVAGSSVFGAQDRAGIIAALRGK
jgi:ribulose-phosphate 3-epimerase